jgi:hypothetical protein
VVQNSAPMLPTATPAPTPTRRSAPCASVQARGADCTPVPRRSNTDAAEPRRVRCHERHTP